MDLDVLAAEYAGAMDIYVLATEFAGAMDIYVLATEFAGAMDIYVLAAEYAGAMDIYVLATEFAGGVDIYVLATEFAGGVGHDAQVIAKSGPMDDGATTRHACGGEFFPAAYLRSDTDFIYRKGLCALPRRLVENVNDHLRQRA
jgi:hypothetical protein